MAASLSAAAPVCAHRASKDSRSAIWQGRSLTFAVADTLRADQHVLIETAPGSPAGQAWLKPVIKDALAGQGQVLVVTATEHHRRQLLDTFSRENLPDALRVEVLEAEADSARSIFPSALSPRAELSIVDYLILFSSLETRDHSTFRWTLPEHLVIVLEEAHLIEALARRALSFQLSLDGLRGLATDLEKGGHKDAAALICAEGADFFRRLADYAAFVRSGVRVTASVPVSAERLLHALEQTAEALRLLESQKGHEQGPGLIRERLLLFAARLFDTINLEDGRVISLELDAEQRGVLHSQPAAVDGPLSALFNVARCLFLVSETLAAMGSFRAIRAALGVPDGAWECVETPRRSGTPGLLVVVPEQFPDPSERDWPLAVTSRFVDVQKASGGRACGVFTSDSVISHFVEHARFLNTRIQRAEEDAPALIDLLPTDGTGSDETELRRPIPCVVIDRLPFTPPDVPHLHWLKEAEPCWFLRYALPRAITAFRRAVLTLQVGRMKRAVLVVLDRRLLERSYSRWFLDSLPPHRISRSLEDVEPFLAGRGKRG